MNSSSSHSTLSHFNELLEALLSISSKTHAEDISAEAAKQIVSFLNADMCIISCWDQEQQVFREWANFAITKKEARPQFGQTDPLDDFPLSKKVVSEKTIVQVHLKDPKADPAEVEVLKKYNCRSLLMLPLVGQDKIIGLIEVLDTQDRTFSQEEILLGRLLSNKVGVLIERRLLLQTAEQSAAELVAIRKASLTLTKQLDLEDVLASVLEITLELFEDASNAHIFLYHEEQLHFGAALWADGRQTGPWAEPRQNGLTYTVARNGETLMIPDMKNHELYQKTPKHWKGAIVGLPLKNENRVIGVMNIAYNQPRQFSTETLNVLQLLGDQAAVAIDRARYIEETKTRARDLETLWQTSLTLTASLDIDVVYNSILQAALELSKDAQDAHLFTYKDRKLSFADSLWTDGRQGVPWAEPRQDGLTYTAVRSGETVAVEDTKDHPLFQNVTSWDRDWQGAIISIPLKIRSRVVGIINVAYDRPHKFSPDFLRLLGLLADQAALSISNARLHMQVMEQARTDPLTGLANRRDFDQKFSDELLRAKRYDRIFSLIMIDLNKFKRVNDTFGHPVGDSTLVEVGQIFSGGIRDTDFLARLGGDEFVIILPETEQEDAAILAEKVKTSLEAFSFTWPDEPVADFKLTLSYGVASYPHDADTTGDLLQFADDALYVQKGRTR